MMRPSLARSLTFGLAISLAPAPLLRAAEPARWLNGPVVGFFAEEGSLDVRAILGVPGAAVASSPLPLLDGASRVRLAPGQRYALVEFANASPAVVVDLVNSGAPIPIADAPPRADLCVFSPMGRSVALYSAAEGVLRIVTGLPGEPRIARELSIGESERIAVSDDGESVLYAGPSGEVYLVLPEAQPVPVFKSARLSAISFLPDRRTAALLDGVHGELYLLDDGYSRSLASGLVGASALATSSSGASLFVAAAEINRAWRVEVGSGATRTLDLPASPLSLEPLRLPDAFLFSARPGEPAWILVAGAAEDRAYFVPAVERGPQ